VPLSKTACFAIAEVLDSSASESPRLKPWATSRGLLDASAAANGQILVGVPLTEHSLLVWRVIYLKQCVSMPVSDVDNELPDTLEPSDPESRFFARQPIFDRKRKVFGHEFFYRPGSQNCFVSATPEDSEEATLSMVQNSILYDFEWLTGGGKSFLNTTRTFLTGNLVTLLPRKSTVLELPDDLEADDEIVETCRLIRCRGYQISLSRFAPRASIEALLPIADYIKIDFRFSDEAQRRDTLAYLKSEGTTAQLVAEKVETEQEFKLAVQEGFNLFQGYFFCVPAMFAREQVPSNTLNHIRLLTAVGKPSYDWWEIEGLVRTDPSLVYRLLRLVNSAGFAIPGEITSVHSALIVLGEEKFRKLAMLTIATELSMGKSPELLFLALQRANFCELAAHSLNQDPSEQYLFGLISLLPALLGTSVKHVTDMLPLSTTVKAAMLGESNGIAAALYSMKRYEMGQDSDWEDSRYRLRDQDVERWYHESLLRAEHAVRPQMSVGA
jgi:EAL and modified HD-GYP domain-containing signal transduction protein